MQPSGRTGRGLASPDGVLVHTTAPGQPRRPLRVHVAQANAPAARYAARVRCSCGLTPYTRLKALDRANALPYPTCRAIASSVSLGVAQAVRGEGEAPAGQVRHRRLAHQLGEPAGERGPRHPGLRGERGDRPGVGGIVLDQPQHPADDGVRRAPRTRRAASASGPGEPGAQRGDDQQVEQPVQDDLLARLVLDDLLREQRRERALPHVGGAATSSGGSASRSRPLISPCTRYVPISITVEPSVRSPQVRTPRSMVAVERPAVGVAALAARQDQRLRRGVGVVGAGVRVGAAGDGEVAGAAAGPARPVSGTIQDVPRTISITVSGARSSMRTAHGGSKHARIMKAPRARGPSRRPARASMSAA